MFVAEFEGGVSVDDGCGYGCEYGFEEVDGCGGDEDAY